MPSMINNQVAVEILESQFEVIKNDIRNDICMERIFEVKYGDGYNRKVTLSSKVEKLDA